MAEKKSIYEEALLDVKRIQEALNANTKEILRSLSREEIDGLVKESLNENDYEEEDVVDVDDSEASEDEDTDSVESGESEETEDDIDTPDSEESDIEVPIEVGDDDQEIEMDAIASDDELDMTDASDDDVVAIYKKLSGDDEIEIVGDKIHLTVDEPGEYIISTNGLNDEEPISSDEVSIDTDEWDEGLTYEIEMDEEEPINEEVEVEDDVEVEEPVIDENENIENMEEEVVQEAIPVGSAQAHRLPGKADIGQPKGAGANNLKESQNVKKLLSETESKYKALLTETTQLKSENEEFRKALKEFRTRLVETVVFNTNLSYVTKLFMEHSTTKEEKKQIIKRFDDEVTNLKESKRLYKTIVNELSSRNPINESIETKITKGVTTSTSKQLNEATAYVDPSTLRIKELMKRVENR